MPEYYAPIVPGTGPVELSEGGIVTPGTTVKLNAEQVKQNKDLIEAGSLVVMEEKKGGDGNK